jgi:hypothetical protein
LVDSAEGCILLKEKRQDYGKAEEKNIALLLLFSGLEI